MFPNIEAEKARGKVTRQFLAEYLGVSHKTVSNWLNGKTEIPAHALIKMSKLWNCSVDYLLGLTSINKTA